MIAAVITAAGSGRRLGGAAKALLRDPDGLSYLEAIARRAREAGAGELVVVTGGRHRAVTEVEAARLGLAVVVNPAAERPMATSVAAGFAFANAAFSAPAAFLWPVDHGCIEAETLAELVRLSREDRAVIPAYRGRGGHPVAVGRALWRELAACGAAPAGARTVLRARPERLVRVDVGDAGVIADVDTPADRERAGTRRPARLSMRFCGR